MAVVEIAVEFNGLEFGFRARAGDRKIFHGFDGTLLLATAAPVVLSGENGVGKTVLARLIAGQLNPTGSSHPDAMTITCAGGRLRSEDVLYVPQNLSGGYDRLAGDLFRSVASVGLRTIPHSLKARLRDSGVTRSDLNTPCDKIDKAQLIKGILAAASVSGAQLIILDEPLAQLDSAAAREVDRLLTAFGSNSGKPLLVIAHPGQVPSAACFVRLERKADGHKVLRSGQAPRPRPPVAQAFDGSPVFNLSIYGPVERSYQLRTGRINLLSSPPGLRPGRIGSLISRALKDRKRVRDGAWKVEIEAINPDEARWPGTIKFLPPDAQTSVVPDDMSLAEATLYDRWEDAPRSRVLGGFDMERLIDSLYDEGRDFFPIDPDEPLFKGRQLSGGNRQMLALRTVSYPIPDAMILPLVYSGLDDANVLKVDHFMAFAAASGSLVIALDAEV